ncbi:response regulator transcription factor [Piscicoccus intestinalis]|uniref:response regulator transcription factor n=1 Tax=Piscicoccus intestinalis TaxID=746033 RepID=UPI0008390136|nr:response regulator transcription factor [Piscicoccus intestinalis]
MNPAREAVTIAIVNDYEVVIKGLARMLEGSPQVRVVELDAGVPVGRPVDIALYDTFTQTQAGESDVDAVLANPNVGKVVIYSWNTQPELVAAARAQGVHGYLSKGLSARDLADALARVDAGELLFPEKPGPEAEAAPASDDYPGRAQGLTCREAEVVALITQGLSNAEIARRSYLSINSVKSYIRTAYRKMGVERRSQAVAWAYEHGFDARPKRLGGVSASRTPPRP